MRSKIAVFTRPFYFLRHGETETNAAGLVAGSLDVELTPRGHEQALAAAVAFADEPITGIYSSPLRRARDTAEPIAVTLGLPVTVIDQLAERRWGVLEGRPRASRVRGVTPAGAETPEEFTRRVLSGFGRIDEPVPLIVAHSGIFRVLCRTLNIVESETPVTNALPMHFVPLGKDAWRLERV